jgi:hypothetical protein
MSIRDVLDKIIIIIIIIHQKLAEAAELITDKVHTISTHQPMYWRMIISSFTGTAVYLQTKQYLLTDLT